ncbi:outer membrane receptor protein involved in Fe transport [Xenorhabdus ehlersii]|uniref:Ferric vulnibactin outer membrane receptor n=2 Tax=Xenorhabdus ehlersii TaxID=290111 RepID=A0A2D0ITX3_9GAMM|nr:ferric vulnibactin outer membrane receptor [Xenorhabdus ehlersii]PHM26884.1 ferric vulnibactin outer membrane receptor [Xenorhabdus ehlersii]RKE90438.1 outer membrane receptor protein involved in Fe transport [Xenorhabdus ehlersii]
MIMIMRIKSIKTVTPIGIKMGNLLFSRRKVLLSSAILFSLSSLGGQATALTQAEKNKTGSDDADVITVTGEKTERSLQRTSSSVTVISGQEIQSKPEATTIVDILQGTPNVLYTSSTGAPSIRGIETNGPLVGGNTFLSKPIPRATISVDGRYISSAEFSLGRGPVWDVNSVEVFRGPQTTTQGANSIAGAVIVKTNDPTFTPEFDGQILYGSHQKKRASFTVNGPLTDDLAVRLAMDYSGRNTFIKYTNPSFSDSDMNKDFENLDVRVKALWQPLDSPWLAKLTYSHMAAKNPDSESASLPYRDLNNLTLSTNRAKTNSDVGILDLQYTFENDMVLSNQLQYSASKYRYTFTKAIPGIANRDSNNVSNEIRLNFGDEYSIWSGVTGLYYSRDKATNVLDNQLGKADADLTNTSVGLFSETTRRFAEKWALTGGLRYQYDQVKHKGVTSYVPGVYHEYSKGFHAILPKVSLAYDVTDDITIGTLISKGYAPGGTGVNFSGHSYYTFAPEKAWNYELFARGNALNNRLLVTGNIFYTDYKGFQSSVEDYTEDRPNGSILVNADKAVTYGLELGADYRVLDNLRLRGGLGLLHTEIKKFADYRGNLFEGKKFAKAPGYMFNVGADWNIIEKVRLSGDLRYVDRYFSNDQNDPELRVSSYLVSNLRLSYNPTNYLELFAYGNNIFDRRAPTQKYNDRKAGTSGYMLEPREVGIGMKVRF